MITTENNCVSCPMGCIHCGKEHEVVYICDECGERSEEMYEVDGDELCLDYLKERCRID